MTDTTIDVGPGAPTDTVHGAPTGAVRAGEPGATPPGAGGHGPPPVPSFNIVPVRALPVVAVVLVGLIVAIASNNLWALTFFHVAGGGLWTSLDLFLGLVLGPIMGSLTIPARIEFTTKFMPKMLLIMPTLVAMTLGAGFQLARHVGNLEADYPHHGWVVASYIVVGIMAVIALGLLEPANLAVLFELKKPRPNGAADTAADEGLHLHGGDHRRAPDPDHPDHDLPGQPMSATADVLPPRVRRARRRGPPPGRIPPGHAHRHFDAGTGS